MEATTRSPALAVPMTVTLPTSGVTVVMVMSVTVTGAVTVTAAFHVADAPLDGSVYCTTMLL